MELHYSEFASWHVLGLVIEWVADMLLSDAVSQLVLASLGLQDEIFLGMTPPRYSENVDRIAVNSDMRQEPRLPLMLERTGRVCMEGVAAHGAYGSAAALGRFYGRLLDALDDEIRGLPAGALSVFVAPHCAKLYDQGLGRACRFGLGFMTDLSDHYFGRVVSPASFGHSGMAGSSFAFADPTHGLVMSVVYNGVTDSATSVRYRRPMLVDALYKELQLSGAPD